MQTTTTSITAAPEIAHLRRALSDSFPALGEDGERISLAVYRELARGRPVNLDELAQRDSGV